LLGPHSQSQEKCTQRARRDGIYQRLRIRSLRAIRVFVEANTAVRLSFTSHDAHVEGVGLWWEGNAFVERWASEDRRGCGVDVHRAVGQAEGGEGNGRLGRKEEAGAAEMMAGRRLDESLGWFSEGRCEDKREGTVIESCLVAM
jgi:hypothetical protein